MPAKRHIPQVDAKLAFFKLYVGRSRIERFGVFTQEAIPRGKNVIQYSGERITNREGIRRAARMFLAGKPERVYMVRLNRRTILDGAVGGSGAEFINHSCDPNLTTRRRRGRIFLFSFRRIEAGEELTVDYGFQCAYPCRCGSKKCRRVICHI
jgi:uncharacterized protein